MKAFWLLARLLGSAGIVLLGGCDGRACCGPPPVASVTVAPAAAALTVGDTVRLVATVKDAGNQVLTDREVTWTTSNPAVATVSATGLVTGVQADAQAIAVTATSEGVHGSAAISVVAALPLTVTSVSPATGPPAGGTSVAVTGTNFINVTSVTIGGSELGNRTVVSLTRITGTTPAASNSGAKDVVVTSSSQGSGTCSGCFSYVATGGQIAFVSTRDGNWEIYLMNADGSGQVNLTNNPAYDDAPAWSPDGTKIAFERSYNGSYIVQDIYLMNADGSGQVNLTNNENDATGAYVCCAAWSPDGSKIALSNDTAGPHGGYDIYVMTADGSGATRLTNDYAQQAAWSPDGTKITFSAWRQGIWDIYLMNADGSGQVNLTNDPALDFSPAWSPDGSKIAFSRDPTIPSQGGDDIYVMNADGSGVTQLTNDPAVDLYPVWSPDGTKLAFTRQRQSENSWELYVMNADGSGQVNLTNNPPGAPVSFAWSPDGTRIAFTNRDIYVMNLDGSGKLNLTNNLGRDGYPAWRPR